jgi:hypothetical protein
MYHRDFLSNRYTILPILHQHFPRKEIFLYDLDRLGLILLEPSGVFYYNQVCGHACLQKFAEGVFSYIRDDGNELYKAVSEHLLNKDGLTPEDADFLDGQFMGSSDAKYLRVDRNHLDDSMEAWVYVIIDQHLIDLSFNDNLQSESIYYNTAFKGFTCTVAVLTWDNSD